MFKINNYLDEKDALAELSNSDFNEISMSSEISVPSDDEAYTFDIKKNTSLEQTSSAARQEKPSPSTNIKTIPRYIEKQNAELIVNPAEENQTKNPGSPTSKVIHPIIMTALKETEVAGNVNLQQIGQVVQQHVQEFITNTLNVREAQFQQASIRKLIAGKETTFNVQNMDIEVLARRITKSLNAHLTQLLTLAKHFNPPDSTDIRIISMRLPGIDMTPRYELTTSSLAYLLHLYFNPLDNYTKIAKTLFSTTSSTHHLECHYSLWLARIAYLNTTNWQVYLKLQLQNEEKLSKSKKNNKVTLSIARVLLQCLQNNKENLSSYSGDKEDLKLLINTLRNNYQSHESAFAMSLLLTLCLRDTSLDLRQSATKFIQGDKNITFEFNQFLESQPLLQLSLSQNDKLKDTIALRNKVFIDLRYACWDDLNLDTIDFSGTDLTKSTFKRSTELFKARYTCFHHVDAKHLTFKEGADCTGSHWRNVDLTESVGNAIIFEWSCINYVTTTNATFLNAKTNALYYGKKNKGDFTKKLTSSIPKEIHSFKKPNEYTTTKLELSTSVPENVMLYAQHCAQRGLAQMYVEDWPQAIKHLTIAINNFIRLPWLLHLAMAHAAYGSYIERKSRHQINKQNVHLPQKKLANQQYNKGLQWLLEAWTLSPDTVSSLQPTSRAINEIMLGVQGWKKLSTTFTLTHHQQYYTNLCNTSSHTEDIPDEKNNAQCTEYLNFVKALWPNDTKLYDTLLNIPNTVGYRQSERIAYETLTASIQRLCVPSQSDDNKSLDTEHVNQNKDLPSIEIRGHSVGNQKLLPSIVQQLIEYKLFDVDADEFKPPQKKKTKKQTEAIKSQHRVICIDCDSNGVYISSEPEVPRQTDTVEPRHVSLHLKIHPDLPMMDYTTDIFNRRLIGHGSPANELVVLTIIHEAKGNKSAYRKRYPALISQTIEGMNLKNMLAKHPEQLKRLDNKSTSEFFIAEVLKHPGDGFSRNYVIKQQSSKTTQIVSVDNSQMFVEPIVEKRELYLKHKELQERSIIYCLPQITQIPLDKRALKTITAIRDVTKLLTAWLETVKAREKSYVALFTNEDFNTWNKDRGKENPFIPYALFRTGAVSLLAMQLRYLQSLFRVRGSQKETIMPHLVMEKLNPRLLHYYKALSKALGHQALTSEAAFKKATGAVQSMSSRQAARAILRKVPDKATTEQQFKKLKETAQTSSLVHLALDELNLLGKQLLANVKDKQAFNITDKGDWELYVDFQPPKKTSSSQFSSVNEINTQKEDTTHTIDEGQAQQITAKIVKTASKQQEWIDNLLIENATFKTLVLSHCLGLDDERLIGLISDSQHLEHLDITGCQQITEKSLRALASHCKKLRILKASRTGIVDATRKTGLGPSRLLPFPKLNTLHLGGYILIAIPLIKHIRRLSLDAPELETLKINKNHYLQSIELPNSIKLSSLNLREAEQLTQLILPPEVKLNTLNLAFCNRLTEAQLTFDSRLLSTLNIESCNQLAHGDFRQQYPWLFTALPWQHYTESFVKKLSTTLDKALTSKGERTNWDKLPTQARETLHGTLYKWGKFGQDVVPELLIALKDKDSWKVHPAAAWALGQCAEHDPNTVISELLITLKDNDSFVRQAAAKALGQCAEHDPNTVISELLIALNDKKDKDSWNVRQTAAQALGQCHALLGPFLKSVIPELLITLKDNDSFVRQAAAKALGQCAEHDPNTVISELLIALNDKDSWNVRQTAAQALGQCHALLGPFLKSVIPELLIALNDKDSLSICQAAAKALGQCAEHDPNTVISELLIALNDKHVYVREAAARALGQCHALLGPFLKSVIPELLIILNDNDSFVRQAAAKALGQCHALLDPFLKSVISELLIALNDKKDKDSWNVREAAARALGQCHALLGPFLKSVIPELLIALNDKDSLSVRQAAAKALGQCAEHDPNTVISELLIALNDKKDKDSWNVRQAAAKALGQCAEHDPNTVISELLIALNDKKDKDSWNVRQAAAKALGQCAEHDPNTVISELLIALNDKHVYVREAAARALGQCHALLGPFLKSVIPELLIALNDKDLWNVRPAAAQALEQCHALLGPFLKSVIPELLIALNDKKDKDSWKVRNAAATALGTIGSVDTLQSWIKNIFNENKATLESTNTFEQQLSSGNTTLYSSDLTQRPSSLHAELPTRHDDSQNKSEEGEDNEKTYGNEI